MKFNLNQIVILTVMASALFISKNLYSQACCTSGSTFLGGLERGGINYSSLSFSIGYEFNNLNSSYNGTTKIDDPFQRNADVQNITLGIEYGLTERMSVLVIPTLLVTKNREITVKDSANMSQKKKFTGTGFGDIILFGKYRLTNRSVFTTFELDLGLGVKLPTGSFTKEDNGTRIPIDLQPGNGAIELISSLYFIKQFPKLNLNLYGNVSYRYIGANFDGYKVGDELFASAFVNYGLLKFLNPSVGLRSRYAKRDFAEGRLLPSTGSYSVFVIPGITYSEGPLNINVYYQIPLHRNIRGIQLTVSEVIGAEVQYIIFTQPP